MSLSSVDLGIVLTIKYVKIDPWEISVHVDIVITLTNLNPTYYKAESVKYIELLLDLKN